MAYYKLRWTERKDEKDRGTGFGMGPRFHPKFNNAEVVADTGRLVTFERIILDSEAVAEQVHCLESWGRNFGIDVEKVENCKDK